jgi:hypothetical protein
MVYRHTYLTQHSLGWGLAQVVGAQSVCVCVCVLNPRVEFDSY